MSGQYFDSESEMDNFYQNNPNNFTLGLMFDFNENTKQFVYTIKVDQNEMVFLDGKNEVGEGIVDH